jgi:hypothetical protein
VARYPHQPRRIRRPTAAISSSSELFRGSLGTAVDHAVSSVVVEQAERRDLVEGGLDSGNLRQHVDAAVVAFDHAFDAAYLPFDAQLAE